MNKLIHGDCLEEMKNIPDKSIDLIVTSPPYNMRTRIRNGKYTTREKSEHFSKKYKHFGDDLLIEEYYNFHKKCLDEMIRISKIVCWNFQIVTGSKEAIFKLIGNYAEIIKDVIIWDKGYGQPAMHKGVLNSCYEMILILEGDDKKGRVIQNSSFGRGKLNNILRIGRGKRISKEHGAVFPLELPMELIKAFSKEGDVILDPFMGSGTTAIACNNLNREFIGIELCKEYLELAKERINSTQSKASTSLKSNSTKVETFK